MNGDGSGKRFALDKRKAFATRDLEYIPTFGPSAPLVSPSRDAFRTVTAEPAGDTNLSLNRAQTPFGTSSAHAPVKTKDNAQHIIPPPRMVFVPHPQLAPPGMTGSRLAKDAAQWLKMRREASERAFKPLVTKPEKGRGWER